MTENEQSEVSEQKSSFHHIEYNFLLSLDSELFE